MMKRYGKWLKGAVVVGTLSIGLASIGVSGGTVRAEDTDEATTSISDVVATSTSALSVVSASASSTTTGTTRADTTASTDSTATNSVTTDSSSSTTTSSETASTTASTTNGTVTVTLAAGKLSLSGGSLAQAGSWLVNWLNSVASVDEVQTISIDGKITVDSLSDYTQLFANLPNLTAISGLSALDMSAVTNVNGMFLSDTSLTDVDFGQTDFSHVTDFANMFSKCTALTTVDTANWQVGSAKSMPYMFSNCPALTKLDVTGWDMSKVTDMGYMFYNGGALKTITGIGDWAVGNVTTFSNMFAFCTSLNNLDVSAWNTSSAKNLSYMFYKDAAISKLDVSAWDTSNVTTIQCIFDWCQAVTSLDVAKWDTSNMTDISYAFANCSVLTGLDIAKWDTGNVTTMRCTFQRLKKVTSLDVSAWDTSKVTNMGYLFSEDVLLTTLPITDWDTSNVTDLDSAFYGDTQLTNLPVSQWNTAKVTILSKTFNHLSALTTLDLTNWDTSAATTYTETFTASTNLQHLTLGSKYDFHQSTAMGLPTASATSPYTGKWQLGTDGDTYTANTLMTTYDGATMAGTYNWETGSTVTTKYVDAAGNAIADATTTTGAKGDDYITTPKTITGYQLTTTPDNASGTYTGHDLTVTYVYAGQLIFSSVPNDFSFGDTTNPITGGTETYTVSLDDPLIVGDYRENGGTWTLSAALTKSFATASGQALDATLYYQDNGQETNIDSTSTQLATGTSTGTGDRVNISSGWSANDGLLLRVNTATARAATYTGTVTWTLGSTVANQ